MAVQMKQQASKAKVVDMEDIEDDLDQESHVDVGHEAKVIDYDFMGSREDYAESRTVACRERIRRQMEEDMKAFLANGGAIRKIAPNVLADPPRKPSTAYGSRPI